MFLLSANLPLLVVFLTVQASDVHASVRAPDVENRGFRTEGAKYFGPLKTPISFLISPPFFTPVRKAFAVISKDKIVAPKDVI